MVYVPPMSISDEALRREMVGELCKACPVVSNVSAWFARVTIRKLHNTYSRTETFTDETFEAKILSYGVDANGVRNLILIRVDTKNTLILPYDKIYKIEPWYDVAEAERIKQELAQKPAPANPAKTTAAKAKPTAKPAAKTAAAKAGD